MAARPALTVDVNAGNHSARRTGEARPKENRVNDQGGFSSEDEEMYERQRQTHANVRYANDARAAEQQEYSLDSQDFDTESSDDENYVREGDEEMMSDEEGDSYDEDEEELSSSPSIPDENIDFDLVYALHNFVATVEGQATVSKGNSLTLLDDSNSYWWLVRVLRTQEVGYIPAENIETPYERLARLNKHRNVDLTSATDDDHNQVPENIITSHLIKSRAAASVSRHSGKLSAMSRRNHGPKPSRASQVDAKHGVQFGEPTYLEHSSYEYSDDEDMDDEDMDDEDMEEDDEEEIDENEDEADYDSESHATGNQAVGAGVVAGAAGVATGAAAATYATTGSDPSRPSDGTEWERRREPEGVQRPGEERAAARQAAEQRMASTTQAPVTENRPNQNSFHPQQMQRSQQQNHGQGPVQAAPSHDARQYLTSPEKNAREAERMSTSTVSSNVSSTGFLPSQVQAGRERATSDASQGSQASIERQSPDSKKEKRSSHRKSRSDEDPTEEKQGKKRSGVFSGLFSRSKDKKERKSGHFSNGSLDADAASEDSSIRQSLTLGGRAVQEKDRAQQEAYHRQFLAESRGDTGRPARPGSLIGTPGSVPMLNVLRVFAGSEVHSGATFKTVLLNDTTTAGDLLRQAAQRFRLGTDMSSYYLTVKLVEGDERVLHADERPLQVFDKLTETLAASARDTPSAIPSVKRSSVGSISSVASNLSLNPAIARLESDFSDDHHVKFYLHHRDFGNDSTFISQGTTSFDSATGGRSREGGYGGAGADDSQHTSLSSSLSADASDPMHSLQNMRFPLRLLIFPSDLPEGLVFDPQTNALIPHKALTARGPAGSTPGEGVPQDYREKILSLPRNITVAEVIEQGLERFGILEGVVEGGDDVEDRSSRRRSKGRIRYGLCVKEAGAVRNLPPNGQVLDAYTKAPQFKPSLSSRRSKHLSTDSSMLLGYYDELSENDPVFILRQMQRTRTARPLSPTENVLASKQEERRQAELDKVAPAPSSRALDEARAATTPAILEQQGMSRQEIIAAQRAAARERRAAVLGSQPNEENGVDVVLDDRSRIRSSRSLGTGQMRYSFIPVSGEERDISAIVEDVLREEKSSMDNLLAPRPTLNGVRSGSATTMDDYVSAPTTPQASSPLSLNEVHANEALDKDDALSRLVRGGQSDSNVEDRIDQVLSRLGRVTPTGAVGQSGQIGGSSSSRETASPISGNTHPSGTTTPTPLSMMTAGAASGAAAGALAHGIRSNAPFGSDTSARSTPRANAGVTAKLLAPPTMTTDRGIQHLYAIADAAARKRPPRRRPVSKIGAVVNSTAHDLQPSVVGLFPPQAPYIEERQIKDAYAPIGRRLNGLEDTLDRLLSDALRTL